MRQVSVDARDKNNRAKQFKVLTTILDASIDGQQIGNYMSAGGPEKSTTSTTAQALSCTSNLWPPRISVSALLQLARWCQQRQSLPQGGEPCPSPSALVCPPVSSGPNAADSTKPSVGVVGGQPTSAAPLGPERTGGASSPAGRSEGGDA